jgi:Asp-tRNA(Asn)/Glu-tRNA(Gln) amidotransferase A subunit family amidase
MSAEFDFMTATELRQRIARREISPVALTRRALDKAAATQASLNAFFLLMPERALDAAREAEEAVLGCIVEQVDSVFEKDPADLTAEFYAGVGTRLRGFVEKQRDLLDRAVAEVLEAALGRDMRGYYEKVFERYAFRDKVRAFFADYDLLVSPVLPVPSLDVAKNIPDHLSDRNLVSWVYYTYPFNLTGQPVATVCAEWDPTACRSGCRSSARPWANMTWCARRRRSSARSSRGTTSLPPRAPATSASDPPGRSPPASMTLPGVRGMSLAPG